MVLSVIHSIQKIFTKDSLLFLTSSKSDYRVKHLYDRTPWQILTKDWPWLILRILPILIQWTELNRTEPNMLNTSIKTSLSSSADIFLLFLFYLFLVFLRGHISSAILRILKLNRTLSIRWVSSLWAWNTKWVWHVHLVKKRMRNSKLLFRSCIYFCFSNLFALASQSRPILHKDKGLESLEWMALANRWVQSLSVYLHLCMSAFAEKGTYFNWFFFFLYFFYKKFLHLWRKRLAGHFHILPCLKMEKHPTYSTWREVSFSKIQRAYLLHHNEAFAV